MTLPASLGEPAPGWAAAFDRQVRRTPGAQSPFTSFDAAIAVVGDARTPSLPGRRGRVQLT